MLDVTLTFRPKWFTPILIYVYFHLASASSKVRAYAYYILSYVKILMDDSKNKICI